MAEKDWQLKAMVADCAGGLMLKEVNGIFYQDCSRMGGQWFIGKSDILADSIIEVSDGERWRCE